MAKRRKVRNGYKGDMERLEMSLVLNEQAIQEDRRRKKWSIHDLRTIKPLSPTQEEMFHAFYNNNNICACGSAGTGKTFLALYLALVEVLEQRSANKIIIVRSAVSTREIGHLPGTLEEKMAEYETPYRDIVADLIGRQATYEDMKHAGIIKFMSTSYIRGLTWDNVIVIVDEAENMNFHEIDSIMTRIGKNSRIVVTGDIIQTDLIKRSNDSSGMPRMIDIIQKMPKFSNIVFTQHDIVRSQFVRDWIIASEDTPE